MYQSRGAAIAPPQWWVTSKSPMAGKSSPSSARRCSRTAGSRSNFSLRREPKWYGAPRPPMAMRPSAVCMA